MVTDKIFAVAPIIMCGGKQIEYIRAQITRCHNPLGGEYFDFDATLPDYTRWRLLFKTLEESGDPAGQMTFTLSGIIILHSTPPGYAIPFPTPARRIRHDR